MDVTAGDLTPAARPLRGAILALVFICLALGGVSALEIRYMSIAHGFPLGWRIVLAATMPRWILLAATLPFALRLAARPSAGITRRRAVLLHVTVFLAISWAQAAIIAWTSAFANPISLQFAWSARLVRAWYNGIPIMVSVYAAVLAAAWALREAREREQRSLRASQLEAQLKAAQLTALRARVQPHFLYNTLHGIAALVVDSQRTEAVAAIEQLSELLHASLRDDGRDFVSLREEVALAERYIELQQMRFGDRLRYRVALDGGVETSTLPLLLLQPLVENAVVHGLEEGQPRLEVVIAAAPHGDGLELRVENDGPTLDASARTNGHGVGLAATRARLATAYGDRASLELLPRDGGGVVVRMLLPRSEAP